ncbi:MAG TPA: ferrochelatase [Candidatus Dormibacteraeota bacterium]|nr:ferrochelatase [Candidatus Dormibacteraeota bacterium]
MSVAQRMKYDAILLLGFGGPNAPEEIRPFVDRVLGGHKIPAARYEQVLSNYARIGGKSPYNERTQEQATALADALRDRGIDTPVELALRNSAPFLTDVLERLTADRAHRVLGIVLSPFQGAAAWDKYVRGADEARQRIGPSAPTIDYIEPYFEHPLFVRAHAHRVMEAFSRFGGSAQDDITLIFTAHSIPSATPGAERYVRQFTRSAQLIAAASGAKSWELAYQSRSGSPMDPWLEPDIRDLLKALPARGSNAAVVSPIGFLCDHVELLYDLDIDASNVAQAVGVRIERAGALNDHPLFIQMLAELSHANMLRSVGAAT